MEVYQPAEDSHLLADVLKSYFGNLVDKDISYLDMGCGSGILSETALDFGIENVLAVDINPDAVEEARRVGAIGVVSNLFNKVEGKFDVISFNAPYLPLDDREPEDSQVATTGGKRGDEVAVLFLKEAKKHLLEGGKIFLLISSLTPISEIEKFGGFEVAKSRIFGEDLIVLQIDN
jgi:release factor glutamine methyltransferase